MQGGKQSFYRYYFSLRWGMRLAAVCLLAAFTVVAAAAPAPALQLGPEALERLTKLAVDTGVTQGEIPAINRPEFIRVVDASLSIEDDEPVFVAWLPDGPRVYPQYIMVWHEVVNEVVDDDRFCLTYSPLTGTLAAYKGKAGDYPALFGVDGRLLYNNSLLFDRATGSIWSQLTGLCIQGSEAGKSLERLPAVWTRWGLVKHALPEARVLVKPSIYRKSYGHDPYGSYMKIDTYYQNDRMVHRFAFTDKRLHMKYPIVGIDVAGRQAAFDIAEMRKTPVLNFRLGPLYLMALYDSALETVRIFDRAHKGRAVELAVREGKLIDLSSGSVWQADGTLLAQNVADYDMQMAKGGITIAPDQERLTEVPSVTSMWFAWLIFYPNTLLLPLDMEWAAGP